MLFNVGPQKHPRTSQRPARSVGLCLGAWILALCPVVQPVDAQETSEIAKQAQNPIASLISVPFENDFNPQTGINKDDSYVLEMKPVVPFTLSNDWNAHSNHYSRDPSAPIWRQAWMERLESETSSC